MLSAPTSTAPAARMRATSTASAAAGAQSRLIFEPASVRSPATSKRFLTAYGTPASAGKGRPCARASSIAAASASARSAVISVKLLNCGSRRRMSPIAACATSTARTRPSRTAAAISSAVAPISSPRSVMAHHRGGLHVGGKLVLHDEFRNRRDTRELRDYRFAARPAQVQARERGGGIHVGGAVFGLHGVSLPENSDAACSEPT